jgi:hypothetical protein
MLVFSFVQLAPGGFKSLVQGGGSLKDGNLSASAGYVTTLQGDTVLVSNPRADKGGSVHALPWTAVEDSQIDAEQTLNANSPVDAENPPQQEIERHREWHLSRKLGPARIAANPDAAAWVPPAVAPDSDAPAFPGQKKPLAAKPLTPKASA